jgi:predicted deacylase
LTIIRYGDESGEGKAYVQAGLHADEVPDFIVMHYLINLLDRADSEDKIKGEFADIVGLLPQGLRYLGA